MYARDGAANVPVAEVGQTGEARAEYGLEGLARLVGEGEVELEVVFDLLQGCQQRLISGALLAHKLCHRLFCLRLCLHIDTKVGQVQC